ncbi:MAG TPA: alpha-amylase family glycosyl hydrolase [Thermodesulfobacteriota bacterium]|nr:alpha-amylase family glycosyl hydrolase [Thermodesulfobacteriota bacterium]
MRGPKYLWWQNGVIYQIYPLSFMDSNGDGMGDLPGIMRRLDYLQWLGIDAIWLSPVYPSPMVDLGYDISDYTDIDPLFGTMKDFDLLLGEVHSRGIKLIMDFVPNHTSDLHPWFLESRSSRDNPKRDWYIWHDPTSDGGPPNNWLSTFGGSAWEWDEKTGQYYYHAFFKEQPDLNWRNPEVQEAMFNVMRFWLDKGVDGFRVDVLWHLMKDDQFRNNPPNPDYEPERDLPYHSQLQSFTTNLPEVHDIIAMMRDVMDEYDERVMIGEVYLPISELVTYYGKEGKGAHLPFNFQLVTLPWSAQEVSAIISQYESSIPSEGWPNWVLGNHDRPRIATRVGAEQARVAAMLQFTLRGTLFVYYGDEIGMHNVEIPQEQIKDRVEKIIPGYNLGRDPERTPMQWDVTRNAGFTTGMPWLPLADDYDKINVEAEKDTPASMLTLYRKLIALRRTEPVFISGKYVPFETMDSVLAYVWRGSDKEFLVALNMGDRTEKLSLKTLKGRIVLGTHLDREGGMVEETLSLRGDEGVIVKLV